MNLHTNYLGLQLRNPIIASSSGFTASADKIKRLEDAGIGAVVLKSIFEEQILNQANVMASDENHPEAGDYINQYIQNHELDKHLNVVQEAKKSCQIPIIASINCVGKGKWTDFAQKFEQAGADALEINIFLLPTDPNMPASHYEEQYFQTAEEVVKKVKIPVSVKLSRNFTNPLYILQKLLFLGVKGGVLFNRLYEPDIEVSSRHVTCADLFSAPKELAPTLRWLALASAKIENLHLAASTGVHSGEDAAKAILAGANAVQICTILYHKSASHVTTIIGELEEALKTMGATSVEEIRGTLNYAQHPGLFERSQFMRYFSQKN